MILKNRSENHCRLTLLRHSKLFTTLFPHEINKLSTACLLLTFAFIEQHRLPSRPIFAHYIISGRNWNFDSFVFGSGRFGFGPGSDSGCRLRTALGLRKPAHVQLWFMLHKVFCQCAGLHVSMVPELENQPSIGYELGYLQNECLRKGLKRQLLPQALACIFY